jgi:hypothetical protein
VVQFLASGWWQLRTLTLLSPPRRPQVANAFPAQLRSLRGCQRNAALQVQIHCSRGTCAFALSIRRNTRSGIIGSSKISVPSGAGASASALARAADASFADPYAESDRPSRDRYFPIGPTAL